ncbi:Pentatricopeptide repeat-containing protein At5g66520 [Linum perenne]
MEEVKQIHASMLKTGLISNTNAVSKLLVSCTSPTSGNLEYAQKVFDRMEGVADTLMWNTVIRGYANSSKPELSLFLYSQMLACSVPHNTYTFPFLLKACSNLSALEETRQIHGQIVKLGFGSEVYATNALLHAYTSSGCVNSGRHLFNLINQPDTVTWNSMINGYMKCGLDKEALKLFHEMQAAGKKLDKVILTSALSACAQLGALDQGRWIHAHIKRSGMQIDSILGCALIDMYAKCGDMEEAIEMFDKMEAKSVHAWTAIIFGFAIHGQGREALTWFRKMKEDGIKPNLVTFTAILTACSYAGLIEEGKLLFNSIEEDHILNPTIEHYGCMVDLLGRAGFLTEAKDLIKRMPVKPNAIIWGSLLKACKIHGNLELGKQIGKLVIEMNPDHGGRYIHLANIHAAAKEWELAAKARRQMKEHGVLKFPGCSTISLNSIVHEFLAGDRTHPEAGTIYSTWNQIADRLLQEGYKPVTRELMLDLEDSEKETVVSQHSEKLAITFGLIHGKPGTVIRIFKNLRVCEDCHTAMKLISRIYNRQIVMRDRTRFHCFRDGECSCADYW